MGRRPRLVRLLGPRGLRHSRHDGPDVLDTNRRSRRDRIESFVSAHLYRASFRLSDAFPGWTPAVSRAAFRATPSTQDRVVEVVEAIHYRRSIEVMRLGCVEVAFKISPDFDTVRWAMQVVFDAPGRMRRVASIR